jgi:hypothetical protein
MKVPFDDPKEAAELDRAHAVAAQMVKNGRGLTKSLGARLARMNIEGARNFKKEFPSYYRKFEDMLEDD